MQFYIDRERAQLMEAWQRSLSKGDWLDRPWYPLRQLLDPRTKDVKMAFRRCHNELGWKASQTLEVLGLCSGAIYRTERFMTLSQERRCGTKKLGQTVHIEHTVPAAELRRMWVPFRDAYAPDAATALSWTLRHSVSTAFHISEKGGLPGYEYRTDAFDPNSRAYNLPFMRYEVHATPPTIWNVFSRERIDPESWTFDDHFATVLALLRETGCRRDLIDVIEDRAREFAPIITPPTCGGLRPGT